MNPDLDTVPHAKPKTRSLCLNTFKSPNRDPSPRLCRSAPSGSARADLVLVHVLELPLLLRSLGKKKRLSVSLHSRIDFFSESDAPQKSKQGKPRVIGHGHRVRDGRGRSSSVSAATGKGGGRMSRRSSSRRTSSRRTRRPVSRSRSSTGIRRVQRDGLLEEGSAQVINAIHLEAPLEDIRLVGPAVEFLGASLPARLSEVDLIATGESPGETSFGFLIFVMIPLSFSSIIYCHLSPADERDFAAEAVDFVMNGSSARPGDCDDLDRRVHDGLCSR